MKIERLKIWLLAAVLTLSGTAMVSSCTSNKDNPLEADIDCKLKNFDGFDVDTRIYDDLDAMFKAAKEDGINLLMASGYLKIKPYSNECSLSQIPASELPKSVSVQLWL